MRNIFIRKPKKGELEDVYTLYREWNKTTLSFRAFSHLVRKAKSNTILVALYDDHLVGFIIIAQGYDIEAEGMKWEITDFYVKPHFRDRGIGSFLITKAQLLAKNAGARHILLFTNLKNKEAQRFYRRHGFREKGRFEYRKILRN